MFCTKCGNELPVNAKFCTKCGTKVEAFQPGSNPAKSDTAESFSTTAGTDTAADPGKTGKPSTTATTKKE